MGEYKFALVAVKIPTELPTLSMKQKAEMNEYIRAMHGGRCCDLLRRLENSFSYYVTLAVTQLMQPYLLYAPLYEVIEEQENGDKLASNPNAITQFADIEVRYDTDKVFLVRSDLKECRIDYESMKYGTCFEGCSKKYKWAVAARKKDIIWGSMKPNWAEEISYIVDGDGQLHKRCDDIVAWKKEVASFIIEADDDTVLAVVNCCGAHRRRYV